MEKLNIRLLAFRGAPGELFGKAEERIAKLLAVKQALRDLQGKKLGLIGEVSEWLVASTVPAGRLQSVLGIGSRYSREGRAARDSNVS